MLFGLPACRLPGFFLPTPSEGDPPRESFKGPVSPPVAPLGATKGAERAGKARSKHPTHSAHPPPPRLVGLCYLGVGPWLCVSACSGQKPGFWARRAAPTETQANSAGFAICGFLQMPVFWANYLHCKVRLAGLAIECFLVGTTHGPRHESVRYPLRGIVGQ